MIEIKGKTIQMEFLKLKVEITIQVEFSQTIEAIPEEQIINRHHLK